MEEISLFLHSLRVFLALWWCCSKSCNRPRNRAGGLTQPSLDWFRTSQDSLRRDREKGKREIGGVYLSRWGSASLHPLHPPPPHVFWGRELWLKHIAAPHSGWAPNKWGGMGAQTERWREREANGGWREESRLKRVVKIMKTNGDGVSWDGEENFICEVSSPGFCRATATPPV